MGPWFVEQDYYAHFDESHPQEEWPKWLHFCEVVSPMVERVHQKARAGHQGVQRWERATRHFLGAMMDARKDVSPRHRKTVLEFSVALEVLLVTGNSGWSRKFRNRAACLGSRNEAEREDIRKRAEALYKAGSDYRHGGELWSLYDSRDSTTSPEGQKSLDVVECRELARKLLLHGLALLDSGTSKSVADLCAEAQCQDKTSSWMTKVIDELYSRLQPWHP